MVKEERRRQENSVHNTRNDVRRRSNPEIHSRQPQFSQNYTGGVQGEWGSSQHAMEVELMRDSQGYGFSIRGGRELDLPIFVLRMADGGAAQRDGRLRVSQHRVVSFSRLLAAGYSRAICFGYIFTIVCFLKTDVHPSSFGPGSFVDCSILIGCYFPSDNFQVRENPAMHSG